MFHRNTTKKLSLALSILFSCSVQAAIIDHGDYLTDTVTGLDWLDVTKTVNMSYIAVSAQLGTGGAYAGWRYATGDEFNVLVGNYTGTPIAPHNYGSVNQEIDKIDGLVSLLGSTVDSYYMHYYNKTYDAYYGNAEGSYLDYTAGYLADNLNGASRYMALIYDTETSPNSIDISIAHHSTNPDSFAQYNIGSFLIRNGETTVPEPTSVALLALGLFGLAAFRRRSGRLG